MIQLFLLASALAFVVGVYAIFFVMTANKKKAGPVYSAEVNRLLAID